jgi:hypothetical protein
MHIFQGKKLLIVLILPKQLINIVMKKIKILDLQFQYKIVNEGYYGIRTDFYLGTKNVTYRKFLLFGPKITKKQPIFCFSFYNNIESIHLSKKQLRDKLEGLVKKHVLRKKEIEDGDLI